MYLKKSNRDLEGMAPTPCPICTIKFIDRLKQKLFKKSDDGIYENRHDYVRFINLINIIKAIPVRVS